VSHGASLAVILLVLAIKPRSSVVVVVSSSVLGAGAGVHRCRRVVVPVVRVLGHALSSPRSGRRGHGRAPCRVVPVGTWYLLSSAASTCDPPCEQRLARLGEGAGASAGLFLVVMGPWCSFSSS
jgi:hypothetical protein